MQDQDLRSIMGLDQAFECFLMDLWSDIAKQRLRGRRFLGNPARFWISMNFNSYPTLPAQALCILLYIDKLLTFCGYNK